MSRVTIEGIDVDFPFHPYEEQVKYMNKVIECLQSRKFGVLESPTGTGKTLSLLCSTLSWLQYQKSLELPAPFDVSQLDVTIDEAGSFTNVIPKYLFPRIIYSSRTHSQLSKAMSELQKTSFKHFKVTILGSRDQMCIHPQVKNETNLTLKNALCSMHMKLKSCHFGNNIEKVKDDITFTEGITDIEDLISKSRKKSCCPYYMARELQDKADVIFMPYNYLFDYHIRKALKISLVNCVVILDEAHNIDKVCEEACSVSLKSSDIALAISDVTKEMQMMYEEAESGFMMVEREYTSDELCFVKEKLSAFESVIDGLHVSKDVTITQNGSYMFELLQKAGIDVHSSEELIRISQQIYEYVSNISDSNSRRGSALKKFADDLSVINSTVKGTDIRRPEKDFRVFIEEETVKHSFGGFKTQKQEKAGKSINYWCFNPGFSLNNVMTDSIRSLILTSGTLAPISSFVKEMSLTSPLTVECTHIVSNDQVFVCKVEVGPRNITLKCNYTNRQNIEYWQELGLTLQNFFRIIPDGVLLFFPGYATLNIAVKMWRESGLWEKLGHLKPIFIEPQQKAELQQVSQEYYKAIETGRGKGAVFMGVCRGKISEGLDFSDQYGRAVIIAGLPYPPLHDPKVKLKKQYIDQNRKTNSELTGDVWYLLEATRAVNQAIGRVIRHSEDYGAIILCDAQFNNQSIVQNLSKWVQQRILKPRLFGESIGLLRGFFRKNQNPVSVKTDKLVCTPSFDHSSSSGYRRYETVNLENFKPPNSQSSVEHTSLNSTTKKQSSSLLSKIKIKTSLTSQLWIVSNLLHHYENLSQLCVPNLSKSCLDNLDKDDLCLTNSKSSSSFQLFNIEMLQNENLLNVLDRMIEDFEHKCISFSEKFKLKPIPSNIFDVPEPSVSFSPEIIAGTHKNFELDCNSSKKVTELIKRLHLLSKSMHEAVVNSLSHHSFNNHLLMDIGLIEESSNAPAKKRKIKLEFIKIDDIQLPGTDHLSREKEKRLNDTKNFLIELKSTLEPRSYSQLIGFIKNFNSEKDFTETVNYLRILFPETDEEFKTIFKRCYLLFTGKWEKEFKKYCDENNI